MSIIVVEDDPGVSDSLRSLLEALGHSVRVHEDGESFFEAAPPEQEDVVILDLGLPGIGGVQVLRWLDGLQTKPTVIVISGQPKKAIERALGRLDGINVLRKPLHADMLAAVLAQVPYPH